MMLFLGGTVLYLFSVTALGIFLATISQSMPQFGLLAIPVYIVMSLLSGGNTPLDSMPEALQVVMYASPATHFMSIAQGILFRGAGLDVMWPEFVAVAGIGAAFRSRKNAKSRASSGESRKSGIRTQPKCRSGRSRNPANAPSWYFAVTPLSDAFSGFPSAVPGA